MASIPEIEARIHALWTTGEARSREEAVALGRLLTTLHTEMPPGDCYRHVQEVLHMPEHDAHHCMTQSRTSRGADHEPVSEG